MNHFFLSFITSSPCLCCTRCRSGLYNLFCTKLYTCQLSGVGTSTRVGQWLSREIQKIVVTYASRQRRHNFVIAKKTLSLHYLHCSRQLLPSIDGSVHTWNDVFVHGTSYRNYRYLLTRGSCRGYSKYHFSIILVSSNMAISSDRQGS